MSTLSLLSVIPSSPQPNILTGQERSGPKKVEGLYLQLAQGLFLRATVLAVRPDNQYLLETDRGHFLVQSQTRLEQGNVLDLQVLDTGTGLKLQVIPPQPAAFLSRLLAAGTASTALTSFAEQFLETTAEQKTGFGERAIETIREFARLLQQSFPSPSAPASPQNVKQTTPRTGSGLPGYVAETLLHQLVEQLDRASTGPSGQPAIQATADTVKTISLLFLEKAEMTPPLQKQADQLTPPQRQILEALSQIRSHAAAGVPAREQVDLVIELLQLQPAVVQTTAPVSPRLSEMKAGLSDLFFLLKGPESVARLFTEGKLPAELLTRIGAAPPHTVSTDTAATPASETGRQLRQLVTSLGLDFESRLARGDTEKATASVKAGLLEMLQNLALQGKLADSTGRAVNTIELFQLLQLHLEKQDTLILPLPLPYLEQGYLVIEDYREQLAQNRGDDADINRFSLYLRLSPLGNLRIDFLSSKEGLYIRFASESDTVSEFMRKHEQDLRDAISGTELHSVSYGRAGEDPLTSILKKDKTEESPLLNTTA